MNARKTGVVGLLCAAGIGAAVWLLWESPPAVDAPQRDSGPHASPSRVTQFDDAVATQPSSPSVGAEATSSADSATPPGPVARAESESRTTDPVAARGGTVAGVVIDARDESRVPGLGVWIAIPESDNRPYATSGDDGAFLLERVPTGEHTLRITDPDLVPVPDPPLVDLREGEDLTGIELRVAPGAIVAGRVYEKESGEGIANAELQLESSDGARDRASSIETLRDGSYEVRGLAAGKLSIRLYSTPGYAHDTVQMERRVFNVEPGQVIEGVDFAVDRGLAIRGRVVDAEGRGLVEASVTAHAGIHGRRADEQTDSTGAFEITGFQPTAEVHLSAHKSGFASTQSVTIAVLDHVKGIEIVLAPEARISGTLVDENGDPLTEYSVRARRANSSIGTQVDRDGTFSIGGLRAGEYAMKAGPRDHGPPEQAEPLEVVTLKEGEHVSGLRLVYAGIPEDGLTIAGRVTNRAGGAIEGAMLFATLPNHRVINAVTDADGRYTIERLHADSVRLTIQHHDYTNSEYNDAYAGDRNVDFVLVERGSIEGRVVDAQTGDPLTQFEAATYFGNNDRPPPMLSGLQTFFDENGAFRFESVDAKPQNVYARAEGYAPAVVPVTVGPGETVTGVVLRLEAGAGVAGVVVGGDGVPVSGARVFAGEVPHEFQRERGTLALTDADGRFELRSLDADVALISAYHPNYAPGAAPLSLRSGSVTSIEIVLPLGARVEGRVTLGGVPVEGASVVASARANLGAAVNTRTEADGTFALAGLEAGDGYATAAVETNHRRNPEHQRTLRREIELRYGEVTIVDFDFAIANAVIEGYVMQSTEPVRRGSVSAEIHAPGVSREQLSSKIDPNGYYRIEGVPGGVDVTLMAVDRTADQPQMRRARIRTDANTVHRVDFDFGMANRVSGRIEGMPEGFSSTVFVLSADAGTERTLDGDALEALIECCFVAISPDNPQGAFEFENLGAGHYPVLIYVIDPDHPVDMPTAIESGHLVFDEMTVVEGGPNEITLQFE